MKEEITQICLKTEKLIGEEWFLQQSENGFVVYFCRSCNEKYQKWISDEKLADNQVDSLSLRKGRQLFFKPEFVDSVSYYGTVSRPTMSFDATEDEKNNYNKNWYKRNGVLKFEIRFEEKWSDEKIIELQKNNCLLEGEILKIPLLKSNTNIFSDYRFWLPEDYFKLRTAAYDFYFERLPYASTLFDYSVFIIPDKPFFFCDVLYVNKSNDLYFNVEANFIEEERLKTLKIIVLSLGINDYKIVN